MRPMVQDEYVHVYERACIYTCLESCCMRRMVEDVYVHVYECACDIYTYLYTPQNLAARGPCTYIYTHSHT